MRGRGTLRRFRGPLVSLVTLVVMLAAVFVVDRVLLQRYGNPLWRYDPVLHYRHIPDARFEWGDKYGNKPIRINHWGQHDDDFPLRKPPGELRVMVVGDSVVMGHGVTEDEAFPNRLEDLLAQRSAGRRSFQIINAGVQGYATDQYVETIRRSDRFDVDGIILGFCMNDVVDPLRVRKRNGGSGFDYHGILEEASWWRGYFVNQTGFGRWALSRRFSREDMRRGRDRFTVRRMAQSLDSDPMYVEAWAAGMADLSAAQRLADERRLWLLVVVFPTRFQVGDPSMQEPQRRLVAYAEEHGIEMLDLTPAFEELAQRRGREWWRDFLDEVHFSPAGHVQVADWLADRLAAMGVVPSAGSETAPTTTSR